MALSYKVGSFTQPTSTNASFAVTGVGFQPKIIILFGNNQTTDGSGAHESFFMGAAVSTTARFGGGIQYKNGVGTAVSGFDEESGFTYIVNNEIPTVLVKADFVSLNADGFTLNFSTVDATARIINYICIGGSDLTHANVGNSTTPTVTGNKSFTGVGFKPDALIFINYTDYPSPLPQSAADNTKMAIGFAVSTTQRGYSGTYNQNATVGSSITKHKQISTKAMGIITTAAATYEADLVSMDADGFTLNFSTVDTAADVFFYIALKGGRYKVGTFTQKTSTGSQATTGIGFPTAGLMFSSVNDTSSTSINNNSHLSFGAGASSTARETIWMGATNGVATTVADSNLDRTNIIKMMTEAATPTTQAAADLTSLDSDGWTLNWGTADATAREILYLAMGNNAASFMEPGGDATFDMSLWTGHGAGGTPSVATDFVHGGHIKSMKFSTTVNNVYVYRQAVGADSGGRISVWIYLNALPTAAVAPLFGMETVGDGSLVFQTQITSGGVLQLGNGGTTQMGTNGSTLSTGVWYRLTLTWKITSSTVNNFKTFVNGVADITVTNATLTRTGTSDFVIGTFESTTNFPDTRASDIYIDNNASLTDPGNIWVTAKRPFANGTSNQWTTQIGAGGSGYGTGHAPQVNERALSTTDGWSIQNAATQTEEYTIEAASAGDIDISSATIVDYMGWLYEKVGVNSTGNMILNGITSNISVTTAYAPFLKVAGSSTYPSTNTAIGADTNAVNQLFSLAEAGIIVAYIPAGTAVKMQGVRGWSWAI